MKNKKRRRGRRDLRPLTGFDIIQFMRPSLLDLRRLAFAALFLLIFQLVYEQVSYTTRFHGPFRWNGFGRGGAAVRAARLPSTFARVDGVILQRAVLLHGAYRPLRITLQYRAPAGASVAVEGDATRGPVSEITIAPMAVVGSPRVQVPAISDAAGLYRVELPPSPDWSRTALSVKEHTDLPFLTLVLAAPDARHPADFTAVSLAYADKPGENLIDNGDFAERWPVWAIHPEWVNPLYVACQGGSRAFAEQAAPSSSPLDPLWPTSWTAIIVLALAGGLLAWKLRRNEGYAPTWLTTIVWIALSALMILGSQAFADLAQLAFERPSLTPIRILGGLLAWAIQLGCFFYAGRVGYRLVGRRARFYGLLIALFGASMIASSVGIVPETGLPQPLIDNVRFLEGIGPLWLLAGAAAVWFGVYRDAPRGGSESVLNNGAD